MCLGMMVLRNDAMAVVLLTQFEDYHARTSFTAI